MTWNDIYWGFLCFIAFPGLTLTFVIATIYFSRPENRGYSDRVERRAPRRRETDEYDRWDVI